MAPPALPCSVLNIIFNSKSLDAASPPPSQLFFIDHPPVSTYLPYISKQVQVLQPARRPADTWTTLEANRHQVINYETWCGSRAFFNESFECRLPITNDSTAAVR